MANAAILELPQSTKKREKLRRERGEGRIYKTQGSSKWWIQYYSSGRQIRESSGSEVKQVAQELLRQRLVEKRNGDAPAVDASKTTYEQMRGLLYDHYEANKCKSLLKKKDGALYVGTVPPLDRFFEGTVAAEITYSRLVAFQKDRQKAGKSPATINRSLNSLKMMFALAVKAKLIPVLSIPEFPKLKEPPAREDYFTQEQYNAISANLPEYLRPVFAVGYYCGMRAEEILSRKWSSVDLKSGVIRLQPGETKNDEGRVVPMAGPALEILKAQRAANPEAEYVFTRNGEPIKDFRKAWKTALEKAGLVAGRKGHTFHGTRRGVATNLMRAGIDVKTAMAITGHKDDKIFRRYQQVAESDVKAAAKRLEAYLTGQVVEISGQVSGQVRTQRRAKVRK